MCVLCLALPDNILILGIPLCSYESVHLTKAKNLRKLEVECWGNDFDLKKIGMQLHDQVPGKFVHFTWYSLIKLSWLGWVRHTIIIRKITLYKTVCRALSVDEAIILTTFNKRKICAKSAPLNSAYRESQQISNLYHLVHYDMQTYPAANTAEQ